MRAPELLESPAWGRRLGFRVAVAAGVVVLIALFGIGSSVFQLSSRSGATSPDGPNAEKVRTGFVALGDVFRLAAITQIIVYEGEVDAGRATEFESATDILFVRIQDLARLEEDARLPEDVTEPVRTSLQELVKRADLVIAQEFSDFDAAARDLFALTDRARKHITIFLDRLSVINTAVYEEQNSALQRQRQILKVSSAILGLAIIVSVLLAWREILARRAYRDAERRYRYLALYDPLTDLPNRVQFQDQMSAQIESGAAFSLMFLDLDGFKRINDTSGHAAGDATLRHVAGILKETAGARSGFAARLAGDEFALILPIAREDALAEICGRLICRTAEPFEFEGEPLTAGLSIGAATTALLGALPPTTQHLARVADFALYSSKSDGRGGFTIFGPKLERAYFERRALLEELPRATSKGLLDIYLQPKVDLSVGRVFGFEALVRWIRRGKIVSPGDFIQVAEETGLILEIDAFVLKNATRKVANYNVAHGTRYSVSVNLSALHFSSERIVSRVRDALSESGLDPGSLTLEITETIELRDQQFAHGVIEKIRELGCRIAIDDFGTGYSSLAYLRAVQADELKIDKSLVDEIGASEEALRVFETVLDLGEQMGMDIVVEGVERESQARIIRRMGAKLVQGYLFSKPLPADEALAAAKDGYADRLAFLDFPAPPPVIEAQGPAEVPLRSTARSHRQAP